MTDGELRFYLREIHPYWSTPRIAEERVAELQKANLIERSTAAVAMIRLTKEGAREKTNSRQRRSNSTLSLVRKPERPVHQGRRRRSTQSRPRPLV